MSFGVKIAERRRCFSEMLVKDEENGEDMAMSHLDPEKRIRREIANNNERRRMQSINVGFESLKKLLPHPEGEKLSKAAILQQTSEHLQNLEAEKKRLSTQNVQLKRMIHEMTREGDGQKSPPPKRKKQDTECTDEGIGLSAENEDSKVMEEMKRELIELRYQLEQERQTRVLLEEQTRSLETHLYPERLRQLVEYQKEKERQKLQEAQHLSSLRHKAMDAALPAALEKQVILPSCHQVEKSLKLQHHDEVINNSMSKRNLEIIVEAIHHLEGEQVLNDEAEAHERDGTHSAGEDSEKESGISTSDQEDSKSESSGCGSPVSSPSSDSVKPQDFAVHAQTFQTDLRGYPLSMQLLFPPLATHYLHRPGVIVHKSS